MSLAAGQEKIQIKPSERPLPPDEGWEQCGEEAARVKIADFDWAGLARCLGECREEVSEEQFKGVVSVFARLFQWMIPASSIRPGGRNVIGNRAVAMAWVLNPSVFEGASLTEICRKFGFSAPVIAVHTGTFSRAFNVRSQAQCHASNYIAGEEETSQDTDPDDEMEAA